jgi:putative aldouronate transport system substrate-binding protein
MMKKVLLLLLIAIFLFTMIAAGCGRQGTSPGDTDATPAPKAQESDSQGNTGDDVEELPEPVYDLPLTTSGETLTIATSDWAPTIGASFADNLPIFQELEKRTGVKIIWDVISSQDYNTTMLTRLSAGTDLPDLFKIPGNVVVHADAGLLMPLDDLIENQTIHLKTLLARYPDVKKAYTAPDGVMYHLPLQFNTEPMVGSMYNNYTIQLREDWLRKVGMDVPETMDDFKEVLRAFVEQDPNGNGENDEEGFSTVIITNLTPLGWSYGLHLFANDGIFPDSNGRIVYEWIEPKTKEFITMLNQWYMEGLIDNEFHTMTGEMLFDKYYNNRAGALVWFNMGPFTGFNLQVQQSSGDPEAGWLAIPTPKGPYGDAIIEHSALPGFGQFGMSRDCRNPELAIKWLDYFAYSEDARMLNMYGIEGVSYDLIDGEPVLQDWVKNSPDGPNIELARLGCGHHDQLPILADATTYHEAFGEYYKQVKYGDAMFEQMKEVGRFPMVMSTLEEDQEINELYPPIVGYRNDMLTKFVTGEISMDQWDAYVETIKQMGIGRFLEIKQIQFDRYMSN